MVNEGAVQEVKDRKTARLEDVAEKVRRIQPKWWQLVSELCAGIFLLGETWWSYAHSSDRNVMFSWGMGCAFVAVFFSNLAIRWRLKSLLYDLVWHG